MAKKGLKKSTGAEDLESLSGETLRSDKADLAEAAQYHINLDELESISPFLEGINDTRYIQEEQEEIMSANTDIQTTQENENLELKIEEVYIPLKDMMRKIFRRALRPVVIISDDKIAYTNPSFLKILGKESAYEVMGRNFWEFVSPEYWDSLSQGIGEILSSNQTLPVGIKTATGQVERINVDAVYIPDEHTFSFILVGVPIEPKTKIISGLYDEATGLPNYYLLEDRVNIAINSKSMKQNISLGKALAALICIEIENAESFTRIGNAEQIFKRLLERILTSIDKQYSFACGKNNNQYWLFIPEIESYKKLVTEVEHLKGLFDAPIEEEFTAYHVKNSFGVSVYPEPATSAKKLFEQAELSVKKALKDGGQRTVIFGE